MSTPHVGQRIRELRKVRQLTATALAERVAISVSLLEKVESGSRAASPGLIARLAQALGVGPDRITGQPYTDGHGSDQQMQAILPELRRILLTYDNPDDLQIAARPLYVLAAEMDQVSRMRQDGQYTQLGPLLPGLLSELTHTAHAARDEAERRRAFWWLARGYRATNSLAHKLGYHDLSLTAVERTHWAADQSGDPLMQVTAAYLKAGAMLRMGAFGSARRLLSGLSAEIERLAPEGALSDEALAVQGAVLLKLAMVEARDGRADAAGERFAEARVAAGLLAADTTHYEMSFGPSNLRIHEVAALIDEGDTEQALARLREWGVEQDRDEWELPGGLAAERASHHHIDVAAARLAEGDRAGAFADLAIARGISPVHTRNHPTVRATAATLVRLDRQQDDSLAGFARWAGV
ncbi:MULTISPECIES: helix-turn-helix transcriptional regulator [unclassified Streptomyces]|uniref:helix-turn-helix domain-containing protein n=1 Tax=unclassified Streptomyces TaxID=2593676 RepID=UPI00081E705E|nr:MULTISPECIES: helix-turn-helix transcriptional regulator [unclassified Streptomyces]MYR28612.1 helix-turn-helix domain-containing protein [Streptomyces sp. SID4945]SCF39619.1 Helix-turn-helix domain-containing protein [Streptomyces sp. LcepLS]